MANHRSLIRSEERRRNRSKRTSRLHPTRPRLVIYRSLKHLEAQIIDDFKGLTLVSASSKDKNLQTEIKKVKNKTEMSEVVGKAIAKKAISEKIESVVQWQPSEEDNTLEGTPDDPRFKYIKYDD